MEVQNSLLEGVLNNCSELVVVIDRDYKVIFINEAMRSALFLCFGKKLNKGGDYRDFVLEPLRDSFEFGFSEVWAGRRFEKEFETVGNGVALWFKYVMTPLKGADNTIQGAM